MREHPGTVIPGHRYHDAPAAIDWLSKVFGFERRAVYEGKNGTIAHAVAAGALVTTPLHDTPYGSRDFTVRDPEGHTWNVGTYDPWGTEE